MNRPLTLEEAAAKTGLPIETLKSRIKRGQLSAVQIPIGTKRYKLGLTQQVVSDLLSTEADDSYTRLWKQYLHEMHVGLISQKNRPVSPKYLELNVQFMGIFWRNTKLKPSLKEINADNLRKAMLYYEIDEKARRDYHASKANLYKIITGFMRLLIREGHKSAADLIAMRALKPGKRFELKKPIYDAAYVDAAIHKNELWTRGRSDYDRKLFTTIIALYAYAGLRKMEPAMLPVNKVDLKRGYMTVYGKGGVEDTVLILPQLVPYLEEWMEYRIKESPLLLTSDDGKPLTNTSIQTRFQRFYESQGIKLRPHDLRRTFATLASASDMPTRLIQKQLRHKRLSTTEGYMMVDDQHLFAYGQKMRERANRETTPSALQVVERRFKY
jgi:integrase